jgi:hypothetical protein
MRVGKHDQQRLRAGLDHAHTLTARNNFAGWGDGPGMPASAAAFEDLLTDDLRVLSPDHADTRTTRISLPPWGSRPLKMYRRLCSNSRRRCADRFNFTRLDEQRSPSWQTPPRAPDVAGWLRQTRSLWQLSGFRAFPVAGH